MERFFGSEGPIVNFLDKTGQLIVLTVLWIVCCIPVFTAGCATSAFYYAVVKSVRREVGYSVKEFKNCFKRTFRSGTIITLGYIAWALLMYVNLKYIENVSGNMNLILLYIYLGLIVLSVCLAVYLFPALSRFDVGLCRLLKMSLCMVFMRLPYTALLTVVPAALVYVAFYHLPVACLFFIPGIWCYASTYLVEPALGRFIPKPKEGEEEWYDM